MYYQRNANILFRDFGDFGYLSDNRNFGYKTANDTEPEIGDRILSKTGTIFVSFLQYTPQSLDELSEKIASVFKDVQISEIKQDARMFFDELSREGFISSGTSVDSCLMAGKHTSSASSIITAKTTSTQEFMDSYFAGTPWLSSLHIEITGKCNERCIHCYIPHENKIRSMPSSLFQSILKQCIDMNLLHISISGGEPMLHDHFILFLKACRENNFSVNVLSNLTLLTDEIITEMKRNPLLSVQTSLYAVDPTIHDAITCMPGSCEKTKASILKLIENNIPIQISCPIMKQNLDHYEHVVQWGHDHNINVNSDYVIIARYDHSDQNLSCRLSIEDIERIMEKEALSDPEYVKTIKSEAESKRSVSPEDSICSVCNSSLCISETGNVYPCAGWQDYSLGNANKSSLQEIWLNSPRVIFLRELKQKDFSACEHCSDKLYCTPCLVRNANESSNGDPCEVNKFFCQTARLRRKLVSRYVGNN